MALINCTECGKEMSSEAKACPHCGCPFKPEKKKGGVKLELLICLLILAVVVGGALLLFMMSDHRLGEVVKKAFYD